MAKMSFITYLTIVMLWHTRSFNIKRSIETHEIQLTMWYIFQKGLKIVFFLYPLLLDGDHLYIKSLCFSVPHCRFLRQFKGQCWARSFAQFDSNLWRTMSSICNARGVCGCGWVGESLTLFSVAQWCCVKIWLPNDIMGCVCVSKSPVSMHFSAPPPPPQCSVSHLYNQNIPPEAKSLHGGLDGVGRDAHLL